jgi:hypothetical protein
MYTKMALFVHLCPFCSFLCLLWPFSCLFIFSILFSLFPRLDCYFGVLTVVCVCYDCLFASFYVRYSPVSIVSIFSVTLRPINLVHNKFRYHNCGYHNFRRKFLVYNNFSQIFRPLRPLSCPVTWLIFRVLAKYSHFVWPHFISKIVIFSFR